MKKVRRYLIASLVCGVGFLFLLPKTVRLIEDLGVKDVWRAWEIVPYLLASDRPSFEIPLVLLLLAIALLVMGVVLASVSRSPSDSR